MAFVDQHRRPHLKPIAGVAIVHLAIGYAFISGLASTAIERLPTVFRVINITEAPPPLPNAPEPPQTRPETPRAVATPRTEVDLPPLPAVDPVLTTRLADEPTRTVETPGPTVLPPPPPPLPSQASAARARGDRGGWITTEDYPARALRNGEEGSVGIRLTIGADGRASDCTITATSGSATLDEATCRLYQRRARFSPARDDAGNPIASTLTDRIRWTIPR